MPSLSLISWKVCWTLRARGSGGPELIKRPARSDRLTKSVKARGDWHLEMVSWNDL